MEKQAKNHMKLIVLILLGVVIIAGITIGSGILQHQSMDTSSKKPGPEIAGVYLPAPRQDIQPFSLTTTENKPFTEKDLKGHWTMLFFGFTNCGMVCPTTMAALNGMYQQLQSSLPLQSLPVVVMVTVDPERDTLSRMGEYVGSFNRNFIGARAEMAETLALEKQMHIAAAKIQADTHGKNQYTVDHSSEILLFNPEGELQAYLTWPHDAYQMSQDYRVILNHAASHA